MTGISKNQIQKLYPHCKWRPYTGECATDQHYVMTKGGEIFGPCWPRTKYFRVMGKSKQVIKNRDVVEILRTFQFLSREEFEGTKKIEA